MAGHDSEVHFPALRYSLWSAQFIVKARWRYVSECAQAVQRQLIGKCVVVVVCGKSGAE